MSARFDGRVAVVTGGASGIGAATAAAFAAAGAAVAIVDRDADGADHHAARLAADGASARVVILDVTDRAGVAPAFDAVAAAFGGIDILVNCAGIGTVNAIENMPVDDWLRVIDVNLNGPFHCIQAVIPYMKARNGGAIVNVASFAARRMSYHGGANYTASKAGLLGLTRHAAFELAHHAIRVNAVCPGPVLTPLVMASTNAAERAATAGLVPLGDWIQPGEVADMILFLAGPESAMCTGASFDIDGGMGVSNGTPYADYMARRGMAVAPPGRTAGGAPA